MSFNSQIYRGEVVHERMEPVGHKFTYPTTFFAFDLNELDELDRKLPLFAYNRSHILRISDEDYLHGQKTAIADQLDAFLPPLARNEKTILVSSPRYLGYAFNPVNFYLRMHGEELIAAVAEVNNTFGDRHIYPLKNLSRSSPTTWTASCGKDFHVSPFNDMEGIYHFTFQVSPDSLFLGVDLHRDGACVIKTWIQGKSKDLNILSITRHTLLHPFDTAMNSMPRILWQAAQLYYKKHLEVHRRPNPESTFTVVNRDQPSDQRNII